MDSENGNGYAHEKIRSNDQSNELGGGRQSAKRPALAEQRKVSVDVFENNNRYR